ncbi:adhesion G protein-coupled receptor G3-like [Melanotaenia boesemani]|uniref:adhesion G protein-coupled receptor G3-like n=1 Tax=Melanotaenia boesemani TaxID=1250792 RepID=UPI001C03DBED|nr:adhesion G protein-coupled receptor G3-like [Melanotaenia boesemani]XP_041832194.1 adhesion G protein-coupled receptor G3-like [Melanotaenia boesemani]
MTRLCWLIQFVSVSFLWTGSYFSSAADSTWYQVGPTDCFQKNLCLVVPDNFYGFISASLWNNSRGDYCIIFLQKNKTIWKTLWKNWPQVENVNGFFQLDIPKNLAQKDGLNITWYTHQNCTTKSSDQCKNQTVQTSICTKSTYDDASCNTTSFNDKYIINMTGKCVNCDNPVKGPDEKIQLNGILNISASEHGEVNANQANELLKGMDNIVSKMNGTSASLSLGPEIEGILVKNTNPKDEGEMSFAYNSDADDLKIIGDRNKLGGFSRTVTVSKEAFIKAMGPNSSTSFAAVFRFLNLTKDEANSTILGDEVVAIEMGEAIKNLTDKINITFNKFKYNGIPQCQSWNGTGGKPNWTDEGCETITNEGNIICQCSHLTFFAILLTPLNETISSSDLNTLTIITQTGCGLSMFFLAAMFFRHFLLRKTKAGKATMILIQLAMSMFLLNFTFLINSFVAGLKNSVGCTIMAAVMHYSMLATFSWFAAQAVHLWLQIYKGGRIVIQHYILKISVLTWLLPGTIAIVLLILGKYGEQTISADDPKNNAAMCWINDNAVHYIVDIGYYVLVFLVTFSTAIFIITWLFWLKRSKTSGTQESQTGKNIVIILGLCCVLGITWGFAFLAYGAFRLPALYIFTILNSFQGFFLFIYYYKTSHAGGTNASESNHKNLQSTSSTSTLNTFMDTFENPYENSSSKKK